jgi:hypothetical protein
MRVKLAWVVRVGGARPTPFTTITITSKVAVYAPAEWADTLTMFHLYQYMYSVVWAMSGMLVGGGRGREGEGVTFHRYVRYSWERHDQNIRLFLTAMTQIRPNDQISFLS